ncbi:MAG: threonine synthase [Thermoproteota archaeon]|nr:threonine synthase [Thermoproteota archaeon]
MKWKTEIMEHYLECINCGAKYDSRETIYVCGRCGDLLDIKYNYREFKDLTESWLNTPLSVWKYKELLPLGRTSNIISLGEGGTNLLECSRLGTTLKLKHLHMKNEGENPTGSFKDRGMTVGVSKAVELGAKIVACASTGNTSASLAAYAAKAGLQSIVLIPSGKIALGKLTQAIVHGARIVQVKGNFDDALQTVFNFTNYHKDIYLLNSINPYRIEGQKTLAYEVYDQLGYEAPDNVILPVGNAGNISAIWKGFKELHILGLIRQLPRMIGIQAENAAPIANAFKLKKRDIKAVTAPETIATAIRIGSPVSWKKALNAVYESQGLMETVTDTEILDAQRQLARLEGLFIEPASAASIAGLKKIVDMGLIGRDEETVCIATGHGLKDPDTIIKSYNINLTEINPMEESIDEALGLKQVMVVKSN